MLCMGERIGWLQFIGDCIGCCMPVGDLNAARLGEGIEAAGDLSDPGTGLLMGPGLLLGMVPGLLWTDAGLRTCKGLMGDVQFCAPGPIGPILG